MREATTCYRSCYLCSFIRGLRRRWMPLSGTSCHLLSVCLRSHLMSMQRRCGFFGWVYGALGLDRRSAIPSYLGAAEGGAQGRGDIGTSATTLRRK